MISWSLLVSIVFIVVFCAVAWFASPKGETQTYVSAFLFSSSSSSASASSAGCFLGIGFRRALPIRTRLDRSIRLLPSSSPPPAQEPISRKYTCLLTISTVSGAQPSSSLRGVVGSCGVRFTISSPLSLSLSLSFPAPFIPTTTTKQTR